MNSGFVLGFAAVVVVVFVVYAVLPTVAADVVVVYVVHPAVAAAVQVIFVVRVLGCLTSRKVWPVPPVVLLVFSLALQAFVEWKLRYGLSCTRVVVRAVDC